MVHLYGLTIDQTLLENTVARMAEAAGVTCSEATLYDFRYPDATHMLLVGEDGNDPASFTIQMPTSYVYRERSWAKYNSCSVRCNFKIDGVQAPIGWSGNNVCLGTISNDQLEPGVTYGINIDAGCTEWGVLIITYKVP
jgi:hypothetical protein